VDKVILTCWYLSKINDELRRVKKDMNNRQLKAVILKSITLISFISVSAFSVSVNFGGNFRTEGDYYTNLTQGYLGDFSKKQLMRGRLLLDPNFIVDDHFSIRSQWSLLESQNITPSHKATKSNGDINDAPLGNGMGMGGFVYGDPNTTTLVLNRAWLEWSSDFGVVRLGRMPFSWGYGLMWDAGGLWDDYGTTFDRLEYRLHLGHIVGALAYSKPRKKSIWGHKNDADFFTFYLQYDNPESDVEGGVIYEKQTRSNRQGGELLDENPNNYPSNSFLAADTPYPLNNNVVDLYLRKTVSYFTLGGEVNWMTGEANNYKNTLSKNANLNALAATANVTYEYHKVKGFIEFLYASGDSNLNNEEMTGFVLLHPNRRAGFILGRELLGKYSSVGTDPGKAGNGSMVVYGNEDAFSGVYFFRPGLRIDWSPSLATGLEVVYAQKASVKSGEDRALGTEIDLGTDYSVYKNFDLGVNVGVLFPGKGVISSMAPDVEKTYTVFGFRTTASLKF